MPNAALKAWGATIKAARLSQSHRQTWRKISMEDSEEKEEENGNKCAGKQSNTIHAYTLNPYGTEASESPVDLKPVQVKGKAASTHSGRTMLSIHSTSDRALKARDSLIFTLSPLFICACSPILCAHYQYCTLLHHTQKILQQTRLLHWADLMPVCTKRMHFPHRQWHLQKQ